MEKLEEEIVEEKVEGEEGEEEEVDGNNVKEINNKENSNIYKDIKSKVEILDAIFHPTETDLISVGLINGKLKM